MDWSSAAVPTKPDGWLLLTEPHAAQSQIVERLPQQRADRFPLQIPARWATKISRYEEDAANDLDGLQVPLPRQNPVDAECTPLSSSSQPYHHEYPCFEEHGQTASETDGQTWRVA